MSTSSSTTTTTTARSSSPTTMTALENSTNPNSGNQNASAAAAALISTSTSLTQFEVIRKWLAKNHKKYYDPEQASNKQLSHFLAQFIQFQEENLGRNAPKPAPTVTRLPFEILVDFQQGGALCHLFSVVFKYKHEQKISKLDLTAFGKRQSIIDLCQQIETCLIESNRLLLPSCYFRTELFGSAHQGLLQQLQTIVTKHKGRVVDSMDDADHIIYPPSSDEGADPTNGGNPWVRVVKRRPKDSLVLVHRYFTPDSHDEWLNGVDMDDDAAAALNESGQSTGASDVYEVTANWLLDTDLYNEWMNQVGYSKEKIFFSI
jgi:SWI/SNF related-matrix-associated actin-dependent regulator of chromatin subfamily C